MTDSKSDTAIDPMVCVGCGVMLPEKTGTTHPYVVSSAACWEIYNIIMEREYSNPAYMSIHRLTVDSYCAQHPGYPGRRSIQSVNVHLVGLHLVLEKGASGDFARAVLGKIAKFFTDRLVWLEPPASMGPITVADVVLAKSADTHIKIVREWAQSVWNSWSAHHRVITDLADDAVKTM